MAQLSDHSYAELLHFRTELRRFLRWSEDQAGQAGLTPMQHQLLLAVRGHPGPSGPSVGDIANYLLVRHSSVAELVDRVETLGLVARSPDPTDARIARLRLTPEGQRRIAALSALHVEELERLGPALTTLMACFAVNDALQRTPQQGQAAHGGE